MFALKLILVILLFSFPGRIFSDTQLLELFQEYIKLKHCRFYNLISCSNHGKFKFNEISQKLDVLGRFSSINETMEFHMKHYVLNILDYSCEKSRSFLSEASTRRYLNDKQKWLILSEIQPENVTEYIESEFENIALRIDSDVKFSLISEAQIEIFDVFNNGFGRNGTIFIEHFASFHIGSKGLNVHKILGRYRNNILNGVTLSSTTVIISKTRENNIDAYMRNRKFNEDNISKFAYSVFVHFHEFANFTHTLRKVDKWFGDDVAGSSDGVAKELVEELSDLASTVCLIKYSRVPYYEFFNQIYKFSASFILRNRGRHNPSLDNNEFLKPFTWNVWILIFLTLISLSISLKVANYFEFKLFDSKPYFSLFTAGLITISVLCQQGTWIIPNRFTSRLLIFIILTLSFILYNYYTSSIVSALLNAKPTELKTYQDLIESGLKIGIQMAPYTLTILRTNLNKDIQEIRKLVFPNNEEPHIWNVTDGLNKVENGPYAYHMESSIAYTQIAKTFDTQAICEVSDKISLIPPTLLNFWLKKGSQYKILMKTNLRKMEEVGIISRNRRIWEVKKPECFSNAILISVGLDQTFFAFFTLFIGLISSCTILIVEKWNFSKN